MRSKHSWLSGPVVDPCKSTADTEESSPTLMYGPYIGRAPVTGACDKTSRKAIPLPFMSAAIAGSRHDVFGLGPAGNTFMIESARRLTRSQRGRSALTLFRTPPHTQPKCRARVADQRGRGAGTGDVDTSPRASQADSRHAFPTAMAPPGWVGIPRKPARTFSDESQDGKMAGRERGEAGSRGFEEAEQISRPACALRG
jgi:hypothetical protein